MRMGAQNFSQGNFKKWRMVWMDINAAERSIIRGLSLKKASFVYPPVKCPNTHWAPATDRGAPSSHCKHVYGLLANGMRGIPKSSGTVIR
jgi:hypothetical protein